MQSVPVLHILVVDNEPLVCESVKLLLVSDGHKVETATSGKEALAHLEKGTFDLILIDYAMPVMKGDELAAAIKARLPNQPILIISARAEMLQSSGSPLVGVYLMQRLYRTTVAYIVDVLHGRRPRRRGSRATRRRFFHSAMGQISLKDH
jgi:CheY-like chemotaxis protein